MKTGLFPPAKRAGLAIHAGLIALLAGVSAWSFWRLSTLPVGPAFVLHLVLGIISFAPIPLLGYRAFALQRALYRLDRDTLEIRWGLRNEIIPLAEIDWIRPVEDLVHPLAPPRLTLPGAMLGFRRHKDLGLVEFVASRRKGLLLVRAPKRVFAISPSAPGEFLDTFARAVELGSLRGAEPKSVYPSLVFARAWQSGIVRYLWLAALFLNLGLAAWTSLLIPAMPVVPLGLRPGQVPEPVPSSQLVIIPLVSTLLGVTGWVVGLFFYRWAKRRAISIALWGAAVLSSLLFLLAVVFIASTPV